MARERGQLARSIPGTRKRISRLSACSMKVLERGFDSTVIRPSMPRSVGLITGISESFSSSSSEVLVYLLGNIIIEMSFALRDDDLTQMK